MQVEIKVTDKICCFGQKRERTLPLFYQKGVVLVPSQLQHVLCLDQRQGQFLVVLEPSPGELPQNEVQEGIRPHGTIVMHVATRYHFCRSSLKYHPKDSSPNLCPKQIVHKKRTNHQTLCNNNNKHDLKIQENEDKQLSDGELALNYRIIFKRLFDCSSFLMENAQDLIVFLLYCINFQFP